MRAFCYSLAKELGIWNVRGMMRQMSSQQLSEWIAFTKLESEERDRESLRRDARAKLEGRMGRRRRR